MGCFEQEYVVVLVVFVGVDVLLGGFQVWFFDEVVDVVYVFVGVGFDVVIVGFWGCWYDVEGDQFVGISGYSCLFDCCVEGGIVVDYMVGWQYQQQCVFIVGQCLQCGDGDCWCGVVFDWFENQCLWYYVVFVQLFGGYEMVFLVGYYDWCFVGDGGYVVLGGLQYCDIVYQWQELFWVCFV